LPSKPRRETRAFVYRAGIGLAGTHITCDATGFPSDLIFISHAHALGNRGPAKLADRRAGRRQIVATEDTLRLLGEVGDRLRSRALPAAFGRPFNLGGQRIEVVHSGFLPGAAGLLCEEGQRRALYLGAFNPEPLVPGLAPADMRQADAVCIDATFGDPGLVFPPRRQVLAEARAFVQSTLTEGRTPVLLASAMGALPALACDLAQAGIPVRAHARFAVELARLHDVCEAIPAIQRAPRRPGADQALLWPAEARNAAALRELRAPRLALVSGSAAHPDVLARMQVDRGFPLTNLPSHDEILAAVQICGAHEVALYQAGAEDLASHLRSRGLDAYPMGPPRQMTLVG
jgi:putative mRNA 3-end processing factor